MAAASGETSRLTVPVRVVEDVTHSESFPLKAYLVYLNVGDPFNPAEYPTAGIPKSDGDSENESTVQIDSNVDMSRAGVYAVDYTFMRNGNTSAMTRLIVVVN